MNKNTHSTKRNFHENYVVFSLDELMILDEKMIEVVIKQLFVSKHLDHHYYFLFSVISLSITSLPRFR